MKKIIAGIILVNGLGALCAQEMPKGAQPAPKIEEPVKKLPELPASGAKVGAEANETPDFKSIMLRTLGLSAQDIRDLKEAAEERQRATAEPVKEEANIVNESVPVSLAPGAKTPLVRIKGGITTTLVFTDSTGALWPVENFNAGNGKVVSIDRLDGEGGAMFTVNAKSYYTPTNGVFKLKGSNSPLTVYFVPGQVEVDGKKELRIQGIGPNGQVGVNKLASVQDQGLLSLLDGVPPEGAKELKTSTTDVRAWSLPNGNVYVRTALHVVSPMWLNSVRSAEGTSAYEFKPASYLLTMHGGDIKQILIQGK